MRESSGQILAAARKLSDDGHLQYCPVRVFLRIVAASIFLLKAISLGSREADANTSLTQLDRCIEALMSSRSDDIHLSGRYAELIARHVRRFKRNLRGRSSGHRPDPTAAYEPNAVDGATGAAGTFGSQYSNLVHNSHAMDGGTTISSFTGGANMGGPAFDFSSDPAHMSMDAWLAQPFDPQVAPFSMETLQPTSGLAIDSLDFLWNIGGS